MANVLLNEFQDDNEYYAYGALAENSDEEPTDPEAPLATDESVTELIVTEAGSYWLTGYDPINDKPGIAYPNCKTLDASGSTGDMVLAGNLQDNIIIAGAGKASLWGGIDGDDTLTGGDDRDVFWYGEGDGNDVMRNFTAGTAETADVLNLYGGRVHAVTRNGGAITVMMENSNGVTLDTESEAAELILYQTEGATSVKGACIGETNKNNTFYFMAEVDYYQGGNRRDTLVLPSGNDPKLVWLDGGQKKIYSGIDVIDGSESSGADQLAGNYGAESIQGGRGTASLWGGWGSANDTLRAGTGDNVLFYGYAEGNDIIQNTHHNDTVKLFNIAPSQLPVADISGSTIRFVTSAGETLMVYGAAATFVLGDGSVWKPDRVSGAWTIVSKK